MIVLLLAVGVAGAVARGRIDRAHATRLSAPQRLSVTCRSPSLGGLLPAIVYLPAGYRSGSSPYRVIYFLHGLPASASSYRANQFVGAAVSDGRNAAIVVEPQGARSDNEDHEYLDLKPTENWPQAISHDLTRCIDARFRTVANRSGRALVGLSAGGYGAMNIGLRNLATFGAVESWSGYFEATDPSGQHKLNLGSPQANAAAAVPRGAGLKAAVNAHAALIAFYVGRQDDRFADDNESFDRALARERIPHLFRTYPGGHSGALWTGESKLWLGYALSALARGA
ncbi:MAG TPA: alpha/beta hydrolase-fold protein [Solirubrobacteraceae bacterium]|nr:alpha/beta hydrolase-fold protein [Solirubrobacteraceae bacterium]